MSINQKRINRMTKRISDEKYGTKHPFDLQRAIAEHVKFEEHDRYDELFFSTPVPLPKFEKPIVEKQKAGWINFFLNLAVELKP